MMTSPNISLRDKSLSEPDIAPQLSIIIPCYNQSKNIERVIRQWHTYLRARIENFEIIVVNDGSSDGTSRIIDGLRGELRRIRVVHQLHVGSGRAIQRGCETARGQYLFQLDPSNPFETSDFMRMWEKRSQALLVLGGPNPSTG